MSAATDDPFETAKQAEKADKQTDAPTQKASNGKARNQAYNEAVAMLKAAFPEEWALEYKTALEKRGLTYVVRLTAEERAEKEAAEAAAKAHEKIRALAKEHGFDVTFNGSEAKSPE